MRQYRMSSGCSFSPKLKSERTWPHLGEQKATLHRMMARQTHLVGYFAPPLPAAPPPPPRRAVDAAREKRLPPPPPELARRSAPSRSTAKATVV